MELGTHKNIKKTLKIFKKKKFHYRHKFSKSENVLRKVTVDLSL